MVPLTERPSAQQTERSGAPRTAASRDMAGLATLEWLLVIAAAGGFAAAMAVGFQNLIDDASYVNRDADTRLINAGVAAARISGNAAAQLIALETSDGDAERSASATAALVALERQCEALESAYADAISDAEWTWLKVPVEIPAPVQTAVPVTEPSPTTAVVVTTQSPQTPHTTPAADGEDPTHTSGRWVCQIRHRAP